jgi:hypothetical protein
MSGSKAAYRVDLKIPRLPRFTQINNNLLVRKPQLFQHNMCSVRPRAAVISVESNLRRISIDLSHAGQCRMSETMSALGDAAEELGMRGTLDDEPNAKCEA